MAGIETGAERRAALPPDLKLGWLSLWIAEGGKQTWLDMAAEVRESSFDILAFRGPMVQRSDFIAYAGDLEAFAAGSVDAAALRSQGGSLHLKLSRSEPGWMRLHVWLRWGHVEHNFTFGIGQDALNEAVAGARATMQRLENAGRGWRPRLLATIAADPAGTPEPIKVPQPASDDRIEDWDSGIETGDVTFRYEIDGYGWYGVEVRIGDATGEFGGGYLTDAMGDMLRGALAMLAGAHRFEFTCNAEPGLTRVTFERVDLRVVGGTRLSARAVHGCRVRVQEIDHFSGADAQVELDAVAHSPRALAEAIYRMAAPHFTDGAQPTNPAALAALEGALLAVREMEAAEIQASGAP
ncbi:hypothetical protein ABS767_13730 [Sphingomonas sp. ST-64]|uniref:Uncharacterized protein n=1 Tax=Sphingomonas plantiphila TaxID=3163295 RepID=A0ABW8YS03_9SPHN